MKRTLAALLIYGLTLGLAFATPVRVCTHPLPPHTMENAQGQPDGYVTKLLQALAPRLDWELQIQYMPWLRLLSEAKDGNCDIIYTVLKRSDYEEFLTYPKTPIQMRANVLVVRRASGIRYDGDLEAFMRRYSIGLYRDKAVNERFEQLRREPWARIDLSTTANQNMQKLMAERFDAAVENSLTAIHELRALNQLEAAEILAPALNVTEAYIAFPKAGKLSQSVRRFDAALAEFKRSPEFRALEQRYEGRH